MSRRSISILCVFLFIFAFIAALLLGDYQRWQSTLAPWQSGLATLFGVLGLLLAASWNDDLRFYRDERIRRHEAQQLAHAFISEFRALRQIYKKRATSLAILKVGLGNNVPEHQRYIFDLIKTPKSTVFENHADKLGLLGEIVSGDISYFFLTIQSDDAARDQLLRPGSVVGKDEVEELYLTSKFRKELCQKIAMKLLDFTEGNPVPEYPRLWDFDILPNGELTYPER